MEDDNNTNGKGDPGIRNQEKKRKHENEEEEEELKLHKFVKEGKLGYANSLLREGINPNAQDKQGDTPLHLTCCSGSALAPEIAKALMKYANPNVVNHMQETPLHKAIYCGHLALTKVLLEFKANVDAQEKFGKTPLHLAIHGGHFKLAKLLCNNSSNLNLQDVDGKSPLHVLIGVHPFFEVDWKLANWLVENGADVNLPNSEALNGVRLRR